MKIEVSKHGALLAAVAAIILTGIVITSAYNANYAAQPANPQIVGHSVDELDWTQTVVKGIFTTLCLGTDCRTAWPSGGAGLPPCAKGQVVKYNTDTSAWECQDDLTGITQPIGCGANTVLSWNGNAWACITPPGGAPSCNKQAQILAWDNTNKAWVCTEWPATLPPCQNGQIVEVVGGTWTCTTPPTGMPTCTIAGQVPTYDGTKWTCGPAATCTNGQLLSWDSTNKIWTCFTPPAGMPTCSIAGQVPTYDGTKWTCGPAATCASGQILKWDNTAKAWTCGTDNTGITQPASCTAGYVLKWIGGAWTCQPDYTGTVLPTCSPTDLLQWTSSGWACVALGTVRYGMPGGYWQQIGKQDIVLNTQGFTQGCGLSGQYNICQVNNYYPMGNLIYGTFVRRSTTVYPAPTEVCIYNYKTSSTSCTAARTDCSPGISCSGYTSGTLCVYSGQWYATDYGFVCGTSTSGQTCAVKQSYQTCSGCVILTCS
jgi:hypothetical protein